MQLFLFAALLALSLSYAKEDGDKGDKKDGKDGKDGKDEKDKKPDKLVKAKALKLNVDNGQWPPSSGPALDFLFEEKGLAFLKKWQPQADKVSKAIGAKTQNKFIANDLCTNEFPCVTLTNASTAKMKKDVKGSTKPEPIAWKKMDKFLTHLSKKKDIKLPHTIHKDLLFGGEVHYGKIVARFTAFKKKELDTQQAVGMLFDTWKMSAFSKKPTAIRAVKSKSDDKPAELQSICLFPKGSNKAQADNFCQGKDKKKSKKGDDDDDEKKDKKDGKGADDDDKGKKDEKEKDESSKKSKKKGDKSGDDKESSEKKSKNSKEKDSKCECSASKEGKDKDGESDGGDHDEEGKGSKEEKKGKSKKKESGSNDDGDTDKAEPKKQRVENLHKMADFMDLYLKGKWPPKEDKDHDDKKGKEKHDKKEKAEKHDKDKQSKKKEKQKDSDKEKSSKDSKSDHGKGGKDTEKSESKPSADKKDGPPKLTFSDDDDKDNAEKETERDGDFKSSSGSSKESESEQNNSDAASDSQDAEAAVGSLRAKPAGKSKKKSKDKPEPTKDKDKSKSKGESKKKEKSKDGDKFESKDEDQKSDYKDKKKSKDKEEEKSKNEDEKSSRRKDRKKSQEKKKKTAKEVEDLAEGKLSDEELQKQIIDERQQVVDEEKEKDNEVASMFSGDDGTADETLGNSDDDLFSGDEGDDASLLERRQEDFLSYGPFSHLDARSMDMSFGAMPNDVPRFARRSDPHWHSVTAGLQARKATLRKQPALRKRQEPPNPLKDHIFSAFGNGIKDASKPSEPQQVDDGQLFTSSNSPSFDGPSKDDFAGAGPGGGVDTGGDRSMDMPDGDAGGDGAAMRRRDQAESKSIRKSEPNIALILPSEYLRLLARRAAARRSESF